MTTLSPMVTPPFTVTQPPIQTLLPTVMGLPYSSPALRMSASSGWPALNRLTRGPSMTLSPKRTSHWSSTMSS